MKNDINAPDDPLNIVFVMILAGKFESLTLVTLNPDAPLKKNHPIQSINVPLIINGIE
jgi:hypothetical protein